MSRLTPRCNARLDSLLNIQSLRLLSDSVTAMAGMPFLLPHAASFAGLDKAAGNLNAIAMNMPKLKDLPLRLESHSAEQYYLYCFVFALTRCRLTVIFIYPSLVSCSLLLNG